MPYQLHAISQVYKQITHTHIQTHGTPYCDLTENEINSYAHQHKEHQHGQRRPG